MSYFIAIKWAILLFPFFALFFTIPFLLLELHKNGSVSLLKGVIVYLFIFYLLCAYLLVILPLPKISEVANLTTPRMQLIPFDFVFDFFKHTSFSIHHKENYLQAIKESYFYVPLFNILLTIPFGMFLRYFKKASFKKVLLYSFFLSLFFELTQLSGLYFLYPRGYRLFDVDDLILNTIGGGIGYFICKPFLSLLPSVESLNEGSRKRAEKVSGFRRGMSLFLDCFLYQIFLLVLKSRSLISSLSIAALYFLLVPLCNELSTLGMRFLHLSIVDEQGKKNVMCFLYRKAIGLFIYFILPLLCYCGMNTWGSSYVKEVYGTLIMGCFFLFQCVSFMKYCFTGKRMCYEKLSKTKIISTIK